MAGSEDVDPALVRAAQRGDPMALGELMEILAPYVGRIFGGFRLPGARLARPLLTLLGDRAMRSFAEHPDPRG